MLFRELIEATLSQIARKQKSITRRFPDFFTNPEKVPGIISKGGLRMQSMEKDLWRFKVHSGSEEGLWYEVVLRWKNLIPEIQRGIQDRRNWTKPKGGQRRVNLKKLAAHIFKKGDVEFDCECLTGDTKIPLLDGRILTMEEILSEFGKDESFWVYASDENGDFIPARAKCLGITKEVNQLVEVVLDNGEKIRCTSNHPFRLRDGSYEQAGQLKEGNSLMPCYTKQTKPNSRFSQTYTKIMLNSKRDSLGRPIWKTVYRIVAEALLCGEHDKKLIEIEGKEKSLVVHHKDFNSCNDCPENLQWLEVLEHWELHTKNHPNAIAAILRAWEDPIKAEQMRESNRKAGKICIEKHPELVDKLIVAGTEFMRSEKGQKGLSERSTRQWNNKETRDLMVVNMQGSKSPEECKAIGERKKKWWAEHPEARKEQGERIKDIAAKTVLRDKTTGRFYNHKVVSVSLINLDEAIPVYDLSVEKYQNFALAAGIYVHNCPADTYYGGDYIRSQPKYQAKYGDQENRPPDKRNPKQYGAHCKHIQALYKSLPWYKTTMAQWLKKEYGSVIQKAEKKASAELTGFQQAAKALGKRKTEAVATADPEVAMKKYYKKTINNKLIQGTYPGEQTYLKFWLLTNGNIIPVEYSHDDTAIDAGVRYPQLLKAGAITGAIQDKDLNISGMAKKLTKAQISKLKNLGIEHRVDTLILDIKGHHFLQPVKSSKELAYYLEYGKEAWEARVATANPEAAMKKYWKAEGKLNGKLTHSTWSGEESYIKFWVLKDGTLIPVKSSHQETAEEAGVDFHDLNKSGTAAGSILNKNLMVAGDYELTDKQISRLKQVAIEHRIDYLIDDVANHNFEQHIGSTKELAYYLEYGKEAWEARGHWRASHEYICPECSFKAHQKDFKEKGVKSENKEFICPKCGTKLNYF